MTFRFTYSATGRPTYTSTGNPSGWDKAQIGFERDPKLLSLIEFFKASFSLYGNNGTIDGARQWFLDTKTANGADSLIKQFIEIDDNDNGGWEEFFTSVISISSIIESYKNSHLIDYTLAQADFWTMFIKRFQSAVDLKSVADLDGNVVAAVPSFTLPLPSQIINKNYSGYLSQPGGFPTNFINDGPNFAINNYIQLDMDVVDLDEITNVSTYPNGLNIVLPPSKFTVEFGGDYVFDLKVEASGGNTTGLRVKGNIYVKWYIQINNQAPVVFTENSFGVAPYESTVYTYTGTLTLNPGDSVYIYGLIIASITPLGAFPFYHIYSIQTLVTPSGAGGAANHPSYYKTLAKTVFADTTCEAFLTHDIARGIVQRITDQDLFVSNELGNPYTSVVYGAVGCGSMIANMLGLHIRGYKLVDKPFQLSMQDWWDGINPLLCLGLGYEKIGGNNKIVCEKADHFFDDSNVSVRFMNITDIKSSYDTDWQFNALQFGFQKWQSQAASGIGSPSGIDDPQTQRSWNDLFKIIGKPLSQLSKWEMASLTIETARRLSVNQSSNYTYDNDIIGISLHDNGGGVYVPETNQDFSVISNLLNSSTRYNSSYTPARTLLRWSKYWSGCLQDYLASFVNFASGVGNFLMNSTKTSACDGDNTGVNVAENGNFAVGTDYLFLPEPLEINHYIDWPTYKYLRDHKNWSIEVSQTEVGFIKCFIKSFSYNKAEGKCSMTVWPKTKFTIQEIESIAMGEDAIPGIKYFEIPEFSGEFE